MVDFTVATFILVASLHIQSTIKVVRTCFRGDAEYNIIKKLEEKKPKMSECQPYTVPTINTIDT
jgi:hypothetical protein